MFFDLHNHVYSTIYINVDILIILYFYVCIWKMCWNTERGVGGGESI
jgi:hypothetical protein